MYLNNKYNTEMYLNHDNYHIVIRAVVVVIVWLLDWQLPMQAVPITT